MVGVINKKRAFTLIELLVVVAIIGILAAVGVVAYNGYTESAKSSTVKTSCKNVEKFIRLETTKCSAGLTDWIFGQKHTTSFQCPLSDPKYNQEGRIAKGAFRNYVASSRCSFCTANNPYKGSNSDLLVFNNWGRINDNHVGHIFISDNNTGIDIYCCHSTPCADTANHRRLNIIP